MIVSGVFFLLVNFKLIPASDFVVPRVLGILFIMIGLIFLFFSGRGPMAHLVRHPRRGVPHASAS